MGQTSSRSITASLDGDRDQPGRLQSDLSKSVEYEHTLESVRDIEAVLRGLNCVVEEGCYAFVALIC